MVPAKVCLKKEAKEKAPDPHCCSYNQLEETDEDYEGFLNERGLWCIRKKEKRGVF